ncbi:hypothetical protein GDO78_015614 [Eleutherodactylus coqui]|uniref:Uncharacterized protein n=1 Tax=Eleutherodactylus coqui TaxID=57060 RepID=A0A8J6JYP6_ELECQ|nr:hypothetical protein GDO78_015614 [Eleutherodactylus coqui]
MVCEFFLLSSIWFVVVIFWMETISMWLFLCHLFQDRAMYQWGDRCVGCLLVGLYWGRAPGNRGLLFPLQDSCHPPRPDHVHNYKG